ncbi:uncharacterized protein DS421_6g179030 [Arachis hypogaea]|nr:uncharacterized protein DS421_6g179030 [Arachis hypogaea]
MSSAVALSLSSTSRHHRFQTCSPPAPFLLVFRLMRHMTGIYNVGGALGFWILCQLYYGLFYSFVPLFMSMHFIIFHMPFNCLMKCYTYHNDKVHPFINI